MIKKFLTIIAIPIIIASCAGDAGNTDAGDTSAGETTENITPEIILGEFDMKAGEFVDMEIKVAGLVDHVCKHGGKKILLVSDDGDVHVESEERFDDELAGSNIVVNGIVREFRVDEAYCLQMEEDNIKSHSEGKTDDELYAHKMEQIQWYRDSMATANSDHLSFYTLEYVSHIVKEEEI
ncbi:MAG: hypothetical protein K8S16_00910 [Bacteroidales bacterium]|nr:hypothetical protein [Bacteroidales bacterium]